MCGSAREPTAAQHDVCVAAQERLQQRNLQQRSMTYVWKCKGIYSSVAWRTYGYEWSARELTVMLHHVYVDVPVALLSHPTPPPPNVMLIVWCKKWQQSRASQMPGAKNKSDAGWHGETYLTECLAKVSINGLYKSVQECLTRVSDESALQMCLAKVSQKSPEWVSGGSVPVEESPAGVLRMRFPADYPKTFQNWEGYPWRVFCKNFFAFGLMAVIIACSVCRAPPLCEVKARPVKCLKLIAWNILKYPKESQGSIMLDCSKFCREAWCWASPKSHSSWKRSKQSKWGLFWQGALLQGPHGAWFAEQSSSLRMWDLSCEIQQIGGEMLRLASSSYCQTLVLNGDQPWVGMHGNLGWLEDHWRPYKF